MANIPIDSKNNEYYEENKEFPIQNPEIMDRVEDSKIEESSDSIEDDEDEEDLNTVEKHRNDIPLQNYKKPKNKDKHMLPVRNKLEMIPIKNKSHSVLQVNY